MYEVQKRDGKIAEFDIAKISSAISKAFDALEKQYHPSTIDQMCIRDRQLAASQPASRPITSSTNTSGRVYAS